MSGVSNGGTKVYEIRVEHESGWFMGTGERWYGVRFKYRPLGSRGRWSKFIATSDAPHDFDNLSIEQMQAMCARHAEGFTSGL